MGTGFRSDTVGGSYRRAITSLEKTLKLFVEIHLPDLSVGIPVGMFGTRSLPYEASKTYRTIMIDFNRQRVRAQIESQRTMLGGV